MSSESLLNFHLTSVKHSKENVYFGHGAVQGDTLSKLTFCFNNGEQSPPKGSYITDPENQTEFPYQCQVCCRFAFGLGRQFQDQKEFFYLASFKILDKNEQEFVNLYGTFSVNETRSIKLADSEKVVSAQVFASGDLTNGVQFIVVDLERLRTSHE
jgi:hypothetical protein